jgi:hypothetical protein
MADESVHNNPRDPIEEIFMRLEEKVVGISHNMALITVALEIKVGSFGEARGSN